MQEQRQFVRLDTRLDLTYTVLPSGMAKQAVTKDTGGGGICLLTDQTLTPGTRLQLAMRVPGAAQPVNFIGEVVWSEPYEVIAKTERRRSVEVGVRFVEIAPRDHDAVMQHVILSLQPHQPARGTSASA